MNGKEIVSRFLEAEAKQDVQGMADVSAENIVFEMPFALPGLPDGVEGKGTVVEFLEQSLGKERGMFTDWNIYNIRIYPGGDPGSYPMISSKIWRATELTPLRWSIVNN
jgi:hypothetical protein